MLGWNYFLYHRFLNGVLISAEWLKATFLSVQVKCTVANAVEFGNNEKLKWSDRFSLSVSVFLWTPSLMPPLSLNERSHCFWPGLKNSQSTFPLRFYKTLPAYMKSDYFVCMCTVSRHTYAPAHTFVLQNTKNMQHILSHIDTTSPINPYWHMNMYKLFVCLTAPACSQISDSRPS